MDTAATGAKVCCILVNWNRWLDTHECLTALRGQTYSELTVVVVDNGSSDGSAERIQAQHPWVDLVQAGSNLGFPRASNLGAAQPVAHAADFLWFLNNDTVPPPDTATKLVLKALEHPHAGIVGSVLHYTHDPERVQAWGGGTINLWSGYSTHFYAPSPLTDHSYLTFASVLVRRSVYDQLGGLTEEAFMYFEDADFSLRARSAGWGLAVAQTTRILHKEGASSEPKSPRLDRMVTSAGLVFLTRHAPVPFLAHAIFMASRILRRLLRGDWKAVRAVLSGAADWRAGRAALLPRT